MCVIALLFQVHPELPLVVAANRDEFYARRSSGPRALAEAPRVVGGQDLERGGTWMGFTPAGLFVGLTNQRTLGPPEPARRSRGEVVLEALRAGSAAAVADFVATLDGREYNPFNLVFGDAGSLHVAYGREGEPVVRVEQLDTGVHVLGNDTLGAPSWKTRHVADRIGPMVTRPWSELAPALRSALADHATPDDAEVPQPPPWMDRDTARRLQATCVHTAAYGTRSMTLAGIGPGAVAHYAFADGPPCVTEPVDETALLAPR
jgi:uncharacterized protein with NRDE domain